MKKKLYGSEACMEVFGTPNPSEVTIRRWRLKWKQENNQIDIQSINATQKFLAENEIDPLFYMFGNRVLDNNIEGDAPDNLYIVFYKPEHEVYFKIHQGSA